MSIAAISGMGEIHYELQQEVRKRLAVVRRKGKDGWGISSKKQETESVKKPIYPMFVVDISETGRSQAYHDEQIELMRARYESGCSLWDGSEPDKEEYPGLPLTPSERLLVAKLFPEKQKKTDEEIG